MQMRQLFRRFSALRETSNGAGKITVELKYVREKKDLGQVREAIAADITKYGDNGRRVLFVIYDPYHLILKENEFSEPILRRPTMLVSFVR